jgi:hypothetical protein
MPAQDTLFMFDAPAEILHPGSRALFRYWEAIRGEDSAPNRRELDLNRIRAFIPSLFILERHRVKGYVWRLAGTGLCYLWRRELTGTPVLSGWDTFEQHTTERLLDGVVRAHQPFVLKFRLFTSLGHDIGAEMLGLPLRSIGGSDTHVFGAVMTFRDIDALGYDRISAIELSTARVIWTEPVPGDNLRQPLRTDVAAAGQALRIISGGLAD